VIALIVGALFGGSALVASSMYAVGIVSILLGGLILGKFKSMSGEPSPFIMELPGYRLPGVKGVLYETGERAWSFVKRAGTIIVVSAVLIWFLSRFDWSLNYLSTEDVSKSMLASIGSAMAVFFVPLGWGQEWEFTVATITGLVAKENVVGTLGVLFGYSEVSEAGNEIWSIIGGMMTPLAGYSFLLFNMLCAPCFAAIGAMRTELGSGKDTLKAVGFQTAFAYSFALAVYQIGLLVTGKPEIWLIAAVAVLLLSGYILFAEKPFAKISGRLAK
jgi:ferrous iron transport protein B